MTEVSLVDVVQNFRALDSHPRSDTENMISLYPNWEQKLMKLADIGELTWYFDKNNPKHASWLLTDGGKNRKVKDVARKYNSTNKEELAETWNGVSKIESMIKDLEVGKKFPPVIVVFGEKYPDSPDSSFIDGVHRSLAAYAYYLRTGEDVGLDAMVGRKGSILKRFINKLK